MAKQRETKPLDSADVSKARVEFEKYKKMMDENFAKAAANRETVERSVPPRVEMRPAFVFAAPGALPPGMAALDAAAPAKSAPDAQPKTVPSSASIMDGLARLLDLSLQAVNASLAGGVSLVNKFSGTEQHLWGGEHECCGEPHGGCDCRSEGPHHGECGCGDCHPSVGNCSCC